MTRLETRYRRLLRLLPDAYRARWEDDMVATFLESMRTGDVDEDLYQEDFGRPGVGDTLAITRLAVQVRLGASGTEPGPLLWGAALRSYALVGVAVFAASGTIEMLSEFIRVGLVPWPVPSDAAPQAAIGTGELVWRLASLTWVGVLLACVFDRSGVARILAVLAVVPSVLQIGAALVHLRGSFLPLTVLSLTHLLVTLSVVAALAAFHPDAPALRRLPWLVAYAVGVLVLATPAILWSLLHARGAASLELASLLLHPQAALLLVFVVVAGRHLVGRSPHGPEWSLTLALVAGAMALQLASTAYVATSSLGASTVLAGNLAQLLVAGLLGVTLAIRARRRWVLASS